MKILWVKFGKLIPVDAGGKIRSYNILRHLSSRHHVTLLSCYGGKRDRVYERELRKHFAHAFFSCNGAPEDSDGILANGLHYFLRLASLVPYAVSKFTSKEARRIVREKLDGREFDVAVCDFLAVSDNFPKLLNTPTVLFQHNVEASLWQRQAQCEQNYLKKVIFKLEAAKMKRYESAAIRKFHHVIAVSEGDKRLMSRAAAENISVVPTGVNLGEFCDASSSGPPGNVVMFTGSMDWEANVDAMLYFCSKIWPEVRSAVPDAKFFIVGRNPDPIVKKLASDSVEVTGTVTSVIEYLKAAAVFVVPLRIGGGTRLKIFEAMAMGKAIVSTNIGAEGLEVQDGRDILLCEEPSDFANRIIQVLRDKDLRERLGRAAANTASKYDWSVVASRFENVLASVADVPGRGACHHHSKR
jgi:glycosyltransferase involved in cell wall biosynthesis